MIAVPRRVRLVSGGIAFLFTLSLFLLLMSRGTDPSSDPRAESGAALDSQPSAVHVASAKGSIQPPRTPATRPTAPLPQDASCITPECHAHFAEAEHIHGPVSTQQCFSCHAQDAGGHQYPLVRAGSETCSFCHTVAGTMKNQHKGLEKGCMTCHQPHVSKAKYLLKATNEKALCETCHAIKTKAFQHEPFGKGECSMCHAPHQSDAKFLLKGGDGALQCARCHDATVKSATAVAFKHTPATEDCAGCHSPHSSDVKHLLKLPMDQTCSNCHPQVMEKFSKAAFKHEPVAVNGQCATCHNPHGSNHAKMLVERQDRLCLQCHDKPLTTTDGREIPDMRPVLVNSKFRHGPVRAGDCTPCHDSHASEHKQLLRAEFPTGFYTPFKLEQYDLCFKCHEKDLVLSETTRNLTKFRDGDRNLHYLHVNRDPKGRSCRSCHAVHGSDSPNHVAQLVRFDGSSWLLEMNFSATENGGTCQPGCHAKSDYDRTRASRPPATLPTPTTQPDGGEP